VPADDSAPALTDGDVDKVWALIAEDLLPCGGRYLKLEPKTRALRVSVGKRSVFALARLVDGLGWEGEGAILKLTCPDKDPRCITHRSVVGREMPLPYEPEVPNTDNRPSDRTATAPGGTDVPVGDLADWHTRTGTQWATGRRGVLSPPTDTADLAGAAADLPSVVAPGVAPAPGTSNRGKPLKGFSSWCHSGAIAGAARWCQRTVRRVFRLRRHLPRGQRVRLWVRYGATVAVCLAVLGSCASACLGMAGRVADSGPTSVTTGTEPLTPPAPPLPTADTAPTTTTEPPPTTTWSMPPPCGPTIGCTTFGGRS
jgi:hypothetical protein